MANDENPESDSHKIEDARSTVSDDLEVVETFSIVTKTEFNNVSANAMLNSGAGV